MGVEVRDELLGIGVELAHPGDDVARETDTDDLHDGLEDEQGEIGEVGVRAVRRTLLEGVEKAIAGGVGVRVHDQEVCGGRGREVAQTERLDEAIEKRHALVASAEAATTKVREQMKRAVWQQCSS